MNIYEACKSAGRFGAIKRNSWPRDRAVFIYFFKRKGDELRAILLEADATSVGNYEPNEAALRANDWVVVAKAVRELESAYDGGKQDRESKRDR